MFRSSIFVTLLAISGSFLGFLVQLLLAKAFGTGPEIDAYFFSISMPTFIAGMLASMMSYTVVPKLVACEIDGDFQKQLMSSIFFACLAISIFLGLSGIAWKELQFSLLSKSTNLRAMNDVSTMAIIGWWIAAFQVMQGCVVAMLNSVRKHIWAALLGLGPYIGMLIYLLSTRSPWIPGVMAGMLIGTIVAVLMSVVILKRYIFPFNLRKICWNELQDLLFATPMNVLAMSCFSAYTIVDAYWAPRAGQGVLAALGYAQRLIIALGNLAVAGPSAVLVPRFAELIREGQIVKFKKMYLKTIFVVGGGSLFLAAALGIFSVEIIVLLFHRGNFHMEDVNTVASTLRCMLPGMVAMLLSVVSLRAIFCFPGATWIGALLGAGWLLFYGFISAWTLNWKASGIALGYSVTWLIYFVVLISIILSANISTRTV